MNKPQDVGQADNGQAPSKAAPAAANPVFESALGKLVFVVLIVAVVTVAGLFVMACLNAFGPPYQSNPDFILTQASSLYWPWDAFVWLVANGGIPGKLVTGIGAVFAIGIKVIARDVRNEWLAFSILGLCLAGIVLCILLMWQLSDLDTLRTLRSPTDLSDSQFKVRLYGVLAATAGWFLLFLGRQVGLSQLAEVTTQAWKDWTGAR